jgi:hypothetical protein
MAFDPEQVAEVRMAAPPSTQLPAAPVALVARPIAEVELPKVDAAW